MEACRKAFTETLLELAKQDKDIIAVTTDARGSVTLGDYAKELPKQFVEGGICRTRAKEVLDKTIGLLEQMNREGLFSSLEKGIFGDVKRPKNGGKGLEGVSLKGAHYMNPFIDLMKGQR